MANQEHNCGKGLRYEFESITIPNQKEVIWLVQVVAKGQCKENGVVQIAHGMAEWAGRYDNFAERLVDAGYIVYANDHRGHGKTAKNIDDIGFWVKTV